MTKEERELALYCLKASSDYHSEVCEECINYPNCDHMIRDDVTETIIKALEQEPCEDCISREYILSKAHCCCDDLADDELCCVDVDDIKEAPSIQPKTGHWIVYEDCEGKTRRCVCDRCRHETGDYTWKNPNFCENCGAKMVEPQESEDK